MNWFTLKREFTPEHIFIYLESFIIIIRFAKLSIKLNSRSCTEKHFQSSSYLGLGRTEINPVRTFTNIRYQFFQTFQTFIWRLWGAIRNNFTQVFFEIECVITIKFSSNFKIFANALLHPCFRILARFSAWICFVYWKLSKRQKSRKTWHRKLQQTEQWKETSTKSTIIQVFCWSNKLLSCLLQRNFHSGEFPPQIRQQTQSLYDQLKKEVTDRSMEVKETLKKFHGRVFHAVSSTHGYMLRYR